MLEAKMTRIAVEPENGDAVLYALFEKIGGDTVKVRTKFDWTILDRDGFIEDLRENVAKEFDIPPYFVDIDRDRLFRRMERWSERFRRLRLIYTKEDLH